MQPPLDEMEPFAESLPESDRPLAAGEGDAMGSVRIGVIRNPKSHYNRKVEAQPIDRPDVLRVAPRGRQEIAEALAEFARQRIETLVIDGGDGTIRDVLTVGMAVFGSDWPKLMVVPSGKTNALALDLGVPKQLRLPDALNLLDNARTVSRRPLQIERQEEGAGRLMGFLFGTGVFNAVIDAGQVAHRFGAFQSTAVGVTAVAGIIQALLGVGRSPWRQTTPMQLAAGADGRPVEQSDRGTPGERYAFGISTLQNFPLGMRPFGKVAGELRFLAWDHPLRRLIAMIPAILMGWDPAFLRRLGFFRGVSDEMRLTLGGNFILDGESYPPGELRISAGPEVQFLVP